MTSTGQLKPLSLRANFSWTLAGNLVYAASSWLMLVVLAKLGTTESVGKFALGLAVTAPIILFAQLQLRAVQATDTKAEYRFQDYLGLRIVMLLAALGLITLIAAAGGYAPDTALTILIIGLGKAVDALSDVMYGRFQHDERMNLISTSLMLKGSLSLLFLGLAFALTGSVVWAAFGWGVASLLVLLGYDLRNIQTILRPADSAPNTLLIDRMAPRFHAATIRQLAWLALPLGITMLLISLNANIPQYFIERFIGESGVGIFAAIAYLITAGTIVISALGQSASPRMARLYANDQLREFRRLEIRLLLIALLLGVLGVVLSLVAGGAILSSLYQPEYGEYADVLAILALAGGIGFASSFAGYSITAARRFRVQPIITGAVLLVTATSCLVLIPLLGLRGAALAIVISMSAQFLLQQGYLESLLQRGGRARMKASV